MGEFTANKSISDIMTESYAAGVLKRMLSASEMRDGSSCFVGTDLVFGKWKGNTQGQSEFAFTAQSESRRLLDQVDI